MLKSFNYKLAQCVYAFSMLIYAVAVRWALVRTTDAFLQQIYSRVVFLWTPNSVDLVCIVLPLCWMH